MAKYKGPRFTADDYYSAATLRAGYTEAQLRAEYTRMRDIAQKRLKRLGEVYGRSETYKKNVNMFPAARDIGRGQLTTLTGKMMQLHQFLGQQTSTVSGMKKHRAATLKGLRQRGYDFVNDKNLDIFGEFMDYNRALRKNGLYDSERVAELANWANDEQIDPEQLKEEFEYWMEAVYMEEGDIPPISDYYKTSKGKLYAAKRKLEATHGKGTLKGAAEKRKQEAEDEDIRTYARRNNRR